jgi:hypothetical protein
VLIEAADTLPICLLAKNPFVPGSVAARRGNPKILVVGLNLQADLDAFIADVTGVTFEEAGNLPLAEIAE